MSILQNAVDSIIMGLEDLNSEDEKRILSCVRNLYAGMLLLFKYKLVELSPPDSDEVLIKTKVLPVYINGQIQWRGNGKSTLDVRQIKERFLSLNIDVDWKKIEKIQNYRNDIEHYFDTKDNNYDELKMMIFDTFLIINKFIANYLDEEAFDLFDELKDGYQNFVEQFIYEKYGSEIHLAIKDGGDLPVSRCPNCYEETFLYDEGFCMYCSNKIPRFECQFCHDTITPEDMDSFPMCSYCAYKWQKAQNE